MKERPGFVGVRRVLKALYYPVVAVALALFAGAIVIAVLGFDWLKAYESLVAGAFGSKASLTESIVKATPLIFTGLSFAIGNRCGLINLGAEGQVYLGGLFASVAAIYCSGLPMALHLPLTLLAGALGGGLWGLLCGSLKLKFGASELITGIMLNYIAIHLISFFVTGPMKEEGAAFPQSGYIPPSAQLVRLLPGTRLHAGIIVAVICVLIYYVFLWKTAAGYEVRLVGLNPGAAKYAGMNSNKNTLLAMFLAGGFAGLAGCSEIVAVQLRLFQDFSQDYGFDGIAVALLGNNSPIGILLSGLLFGFLRSGSNKMQMSANVPISIVQILQAFVILFVVGREMFNFFKKLNREKMLAQAEGRR